MPAPPLANTFESGQADTTVITTGNSAVGGDAFSTVLASPTYSTTQEHSGTLSMNVNTTGTYTETNAQWTGFGSILTSVWFRFYLYATANPGSNLRICGIRTNAANSAFVNLRTTGIPQILNAAQAGSFCDGTVAITLNQWVRIEARILSSTTVGEAEYWLYNTPDAPITLFDDHVTSAATQVLGANTDQVRFGAVTASGPASYVFWMDDVAVSTTGQIGPSVVAQQTYPFDAIPFMTNTRI